MAYETDLLEFGDIFDGSKEIWALVAKLKSEALAEIAAIDTMGGAVKAIELGRQRPGSSNSNTRRLEAIERGEQIVVGVNAFTNSEPSPLTAGKNSIMVPSAEAEAEQVERLKAWRAERDQARVREALKALRSAAASGANIMPASIEAAKAGATTGEWGDALRAEFGEFRAPTGVSPYARQEAAGLDALRGEVQRVSLKLGRRIKFLLGKPGLDGHSNGAEQIAARATDAGMEAIYDGIRLTPSDIVERAKEGVHCVGLSILSGSHIALTEEVMALMRAAGLERVRADRRASSACRRRPVASRGRCGRLYPQGFRDQHDARRDRLGDRAASRPDADSQSRLRSLCRGRLRAAFAAAVGQRGPANSRTPATTSVSIDVTYAV